MTVREIVQIDEEKCDGCGICVPACEEGAIQIIDGKAKVVSEVYCDGLGACLGHCPRGAISVVRREAADFDQQAVARHLQNWRPARPEGGGFSCPGTTPRQLIHEEQETSHANNEPRSQLANWPVQLHLVPPHAHFLWHTDVLLVADCVPFACADFHRRLLQGRPVLIGCPKLDDCQRYLTKLTAILQQAQLRSITVVHMEVPCCSGLVRLAETALREAGVSLPLNRIEVTRNGDSSLLKGHRDPSSANVPPLPGTGTQLTVLSK